MAGTSKYNRTLNEADASCVFLEWDSHFFGLRIARMEHERLTSERVRKAFAWCSEQGIECLYLAAAGDDAQTVTLAEANHFRLVDLRVTFARPIAVVPPLPQNIRPWRESDLAALRTMAGESHLDSRFYFDGKFPRERCDELYRVWIERSCRGWADTVLVAEEDGHPTGYVSCHLQPEKTGSIGLLAVAAEYRGAGIGRQLVGAALRYFLENGRTRSLVVSQGRNLASQRLYQRCGFLTDSVLLYYHRWFTKHSER